MVDRSPQEGALQVTRGTNPTLFDSTPFSSDPLRLFGQLVPVRLR